MRRSVTTLSSHVSDAIIESDTHFALHLERFYYAVVSVSADQLNTARDR